MYLRIEGIIIRKKYDPTNEIIQYISIYCTTPQMRIENNNLVFILEGIIQIMREVILMTEVFIVGKRLILGQKLKIPSSIIYN